ncbi:MAG TPA: CinA family protein [Herpetosiphonaceae bacterium]
MTEAAIEYSRRIGAALQQRHWTIATAESCTGGLVGHLLTEIAGSSAYYQGGVVAYSNAVKHSHLGVPSVILETEGAVSEATARAMAQGVRERLDTTVGVSTTGIAGPGGGTATKPVGLVYMCVVTPEATLCRRYVFDGDRQGNKQQTALRALELILAALEQHT